MKRKQIRDYILMKRHEHEDEYAISTETYSDPVTIKAEIWDGFGRMKVNEFGGSMDDEMLMLYQGDHPIRESDGICVFSDGDPDYEVAKVVRTSPRQIRLKRRLP